MFKPLCGSEINWLDTFLLRRINEVENISGRDPGVLGVSELDGFFTSIVSGPKVIPASQWLPCLWGDIGPVWEDEDFITAFMLMRRHMNCIAATLMQRPQAFEPMFLEHDYNNQTCVVVDAWCKGYLRGVLLARDHWHLDDLEMEILLVPIKAFYGEQASRTYNRFSLTEIENIRYAICRNARDIYTFWLADRRVKGQLPEKSQNY